MLDFLKKPLFQIDGLTLTVGVALILAILIWWFMTHK